ncbi:hypothetical protein EN829_015040 [Mesorhizobium sp. M00.F.Ca.ET.186.01.1.1]|nr:hypothetical protein EN848_14395 [bacterium M00.F.Ca.ET.205.01.1.1]TGU52997.1 hypothetical protein EN795_15000 [bacterium M00.F.Ca.ET.152.01.1.1]TGV35966.1 hypothetical protein EN829_015040 [Mesorhizobium sp. M00.F.Ca.ET.186.01.1.1]TGZ43549.1 hypothetical protein EN805_10610 [bacterium M00.F.Ca.ET.162.01.1.1]
MVGLLDIAPLTEKVTVSGKQIEVFGVSAAGIASLITDFPEIKKLMSGKEVDVSSLLAMSGDAIAAVIAAGVGHPGDEAYQTAAGRLPLEAQVDILGAIIKVTLPNGIGPFLEKLTALLAVKDGAVALAKAPATKSRK